MLEKFIMRLIRWLIIPLALTLLGLILSIIYFFNFDPGRSNLSVKHSANNIRNNRGVISGTFTAQENYLEAISIKFDNKKTLTGNSIFRIKNVMDDDWYFVATVSASQYFEMPQYLFGIPVIKKSKNQKYKFEIIKTPKLNLSNITPLMSQYQFPETILIGNKKFLTEFIFKKLLYYASDNMYRGVFMFYSIPLILYLLYIIFGHKLSSFKQILFKPYLLLVILYMGITIFIFPAYSDKMTGLLALLWAIAMIAYRLESSYTFGIALILVILSPFLISAHMEFIVWKSTTLAYIILIVGIAHLTLEVSPIFIKIIKTKLIKSLTTLLRFIVKKFDDLLIGLLNFFKQTIVSFLILIFNKKPRTFFDWIIFIGKFFLLMISLVIIFIASLAVVQQIYHVLRIINHKKIRLSMNPIIETVEPQLIYKGTNVIIYGEKFGWDVKKSRALIDGQLIDPVLWHNSKIIFPAPLHWKNGIHKIWVEKQINWDGKNVVTKSKSFEIKILPITNNFTKDDELYFEQLKKLKKETLELNGYK